MIDARENLNRFTTLFGNVLAGLGVIRLDTSLTVAGIACSAVSATLALISNGYPQKSQGEISIEGSTLDSLHAANLRRRLNKTLTLERAFQVAIVDGADLHIAWQYDGFCRSDHENSIDFSVDSENNVSFEELDCMAFDLINDPGRQRQIRPTLVGSDGLSKKISVPFLQPISQDQRFSVLLNCRLPACVTTGVQYYTSSLSFDQRAIRSTSVHLIFLTIRPDCVKVYDFDRRGRPKFVNELRPFRDDGVSCEFVDMSQNVPGQSVRVYIYNVPAGRNALPGEQANCLKAPSLPIR